MAGGKLSPRQKMINLMYLIFIAMLAMQMDKKVLSSFGFMKEKIEDANVASSTNIDNILSSLNTKATDQPDKFEGLNKKAQEINKLSEDLFVYMSALKDSILSDTEDYNTLTGRDLGSKMTGVYGEIAYSFDLKGVEKLTPFLRYEKYNTHAETEGSLVANSAFDKNELIFGLNYKVAEGAAFKVDYQLVNNAVSASETGKQFNAGVAVWF